MFGFEKFKRKWERKKLKKKCKKINLNLINRF